MKGRAMTDPGLVHVTRGNLVESEHCGRIVVSDSAGHVAFKVGDSKIPVFPRSAVKALQALPLVETGAADALGLTDAELALTCSSHNGEPAHIDAAASMLRKAGYEKTVLECGAHWPRRLEDQRRLILGKTEPEAIHNNCSGKHAGFVCLARSRSIDPAGYIRREHKVQQEIGACLQELTGQAHETDACGTDGCSIPTYAIPLESMAKAFAAFGTGEGLAPDRMRAAKRLRRACANHAFNVAGTDRFCTGVMDHFGERVFVKTGAEGVFCATFPEVGLGVALKCADGATRASEVLMAHVIAAFLPLKADDESFLEWYLRPTVRNWNGFEVGAVVASMNLVDALRRASKVS
ncbi:MAG: asparaginase [Pseudomonadota bacterium]